MFSFSRKKEEPLLGSAFESKPADEGLLDYNWRTMHSICNGTMTIYNEVGSTYETSQPHDQYYSCEYCGSLLHDNELKCQCCGAPRTAKKRWLR